MVTEEQELNWVSEYVVAILKAPTWVAPISKFVDENCSTFEDVEENKLEHTLIHNAFKQLIDELLTAHLEELQVSTELFTKFCERGLTGNNELHRSLVEQLLSVEDFLVFKAMMVKRNADLHREVVGPSPLIRRSPEEEAEAQMAGGGALALDSLPPSYQDDAERIEAERKCVEAELQLAEALSLQLEKRLQLMEALDEVLELVAKIYKLQADAMEAKIAEEMAAQQAAEDAAAAGLAPLGQQPLAPPFSAPLAPLEPLTAAPLAPLEPLAQPHHMPGPALPSSVCVRPLNEAPLAAPPAPMSNPADILALERKRTEAAVQKERASRAAAARAAPPAYTPAAYTPELVIAATQAPCYPAPAEASLAAPHQPTDEERRARAEHLKRQRELLVQKKNQEREAQLTNHQAIYGQTNAARVAERACAQPSPLQQAPLSPDDAGRRLAAELSGVAAPVVTGPTPETKAQEMRKVLTRQLKATLTGSMSGTF